MRRHQWKPTESIVNGEPVQRCLHCNAERVRDTSTKRLYLYRGPAKMPGRAVPLSLDLWQAYVAGVQPECVERTPRGACEGCGTKVGVERMTDPWDAEINGIERKAYLCVPCYNERVMDI